MQDVKKPGLSASTLKVIAILAMTVDHLAWNYVPTMSLLGQVLHFVGRFTAPIMCWSLAQGYRHTRSVKKYAMRLGIFALVSQVPFALYTRGTVQSLYFNMLYTLLLGLAAIYVWDKVKSLPLQMGLIFGILVLSMWGDWGFFAVIMCLIFYLLEAIPQWRWVAMGALALIMLLGGPFTIDALAGRVMHLGVMGGMWLITLYNGEKGKSLPGGRWFFYLYYPAHLLAIYLVGVYL